MEPSVDSPPVEISNSDEFPMTWTPEEDRRIWDYVVENQDKYSHESRMFWKDFIKKTDSKLSIADILERFNTHLSPNLHKTDLDVRAKLKLYRKCAFPVNEEFLKTLKRHFQLKVDENGCLVYYKTLKSSPATRFAKKRGSLEENTDQKVTKKTKRTERPSEVVLEKVQVEKDVENAQNSEIVDENSTMELEILEDSSYQCSQSICDSLIIDDNGSQSTDQSKEILEHVKTELMDEPESGGYHHHHHQHWSPQIENEHLLADRIVSAMSINLNGMIANCVEAAMRDFRETLREEMAGMMRKMEELEERVKQIGNQMERSSQSKENQPEMPAKL